MTKTPDLIAGFNCGPEYDKHMQALWDAYRETIRNEKSFKSSYADDERGWFDRTEFKTVDHYLIRETRKMLLRSELHVTLSCFYVKAATEAKILKKDSEYLKKGEFPQRRAAADFATMVSHYELFGFDLGYRLAIASLHNTALKMANRFHITPNRADPFLKYEADVMEDLRLWTKKDPEENEAKIYKFTPGPMLHDFIRLLEDVIERGQKEIAAVLANEPSPNLVGPRAVARLPLKPFLVTVEEFQAQARQVAPEASGASMASE